MRHTYAHLQKDFNFEFMKGGGAVPAPNPRAEAEARIMEQQAAEARADAKAKREEKQRARQERIDMADSQSRIGNAYNSTLSDFTNRLSSKGIDTNSGYGAEISNLIRSGLDRARSGAPKIVTDANSIFSSTIYDDAYNNVRQSARSKLNKELDGFMGDGFAESTFTDTSDDDILRSILNQQKSDVMARAESSKARGILNDAGYDRFMRDLTNAEQAGFAKANTIGDGVLSNYRKDLNDFGAQQRNRANEYDFTDNFDVNNVRTQFDSRINAKKSSLQGDILAALGGTKFFDEDMLLGTATGASGVQNNTVGAGSPLSTGSTSTGLTSPYAQNTASNTDGDKKQNQVF